MSQRRTIVHTRVDCGSISVDQLSSSVERERRLATEVRAHQFTKARAIVRDHRIEQRARKACYVARIEMGVFAARLETRCIAGVRSCTTVLR